MAQILPDVTTDFARQSWTDLRLILNRPRAQLLPYIAQLLPRSRQDKRDKSHTILFKKGL